MRVKLGPNAATIQNDFKQVYGDKALSYATVARWVKIFRGGIERTKDALRSGRPRTAVVNLNIDLVRNVIEDNPYCTYDEIEVQSSSLFTIILNFEK